MRCREQPEMDKAVCRDTKGCSSERAASSLDHTKKLIHSSGDFYQSDSGEQPFVKRKWNRASLTAEASLALPVFLVTVLVLLKIVDLYRLHGMLTVSLQESARYLSVCAYAVDDTGKETYEIPETAACIAYAEAKIPKEIRKNGTVTLLGSSVKNGWLELKAVYWPKMGNRLVPVRSRGITACAKVHLFCGRTDDESEEDAGEAKQMVWVTENKEPVQALRLQMSARIPARFQPSEAEVRLHTPPVPSTQNLRLEIPLPAAGTAAIPATRYVPPESATRCPPETEHPSAQD